LLKRLNVDDNAAKSFDIVAIRESYIIILMIHKQNYFQICI